MTTPTPINPSPEGPLPPAPPTPGALLEPAKQKNSTVGLIGLIVGALGFVFAIIPGAALLGWILLPVAFVLGIVAMFQAGKKTFGILAIVLSIVGTIAGVIALTAVVSSAVDDALAETSVEIQTTKPEAEVAPTEEGAAEDQPAPAEKPAAEVGTRENPAPIGVAFSSRDWEVVVNSVTLDATAEVLAANEINGPPEPGFQYMLVNLTVTYTGEDSSLDSMVSLAYVSAAGEVFNTFDAFAVAPEPRFGMNELYTDASSTGNEVIAIPVAADGLLRVSPGLLAEEVFVKTS